MVYFESIIGQVNEMFGKIYDIHRSAWVDQESMKSIEASMNSNSEFDEYESEKEMDKILARFDKFDLVRPFDAALPDMPKDIQEYYETHKTKDIKPYDFEESGWSKKFKDAITKYFESAFPLDTKISYDE